MSERPASVSIHVTAIAAKEAERARLEADVAAFVRKRGKRIEVLPALGVAPPAPLSYRERQDQITHSDRQRTAARRRRSAAHA